MKTTMLVLLLLLTVAQGLSAQMKCDPSDTPSTCLSKLIGQLEGAPQTKEIQDKASQELTALEWEQLTSKATGLNTSDLGLESATEDFLPFLRIAFAAAGLQEGVDRSALNFERKLGTFGFDQSWELKLKGGVNDAEVFGPLKMAFDEQVRDQRTEQLKGQLEDFDDYSLTLDLNRSSDRFGRTPSDYSQEVFQNMFLKVVQDTRFDNSRSFDLVRLLESEGIAQDQTFGQMPELKALKIEQAVVAAAKGAFGNVEQLKKKADELALFQLADLLNNQPQINASGSYRRREGAAGPDEITIKASYEYGFANLNRLRHECGKPSENMLTFADCYSTFLKNSGVQAQIEHGDRFSITAEYNEVDAYKFSLPADQIDLDLDSQNGLVLTLAYARYIDLSVLGDSNSRIDVTGKYESENDRGVISLTYTNRLFQSLGGSIGISYANHERFLPDSDQVLSAHFGLSFNSFSKNPPKKNPPSTNTP